MEIEITPELEAAVDDATIFWVPASRFAFPTSRTTVTSLLERRGRRTHTVLDLDWRPMFWDSAAQAATEADRTDARPRHDRDRQPATSARSPWAPRDPDQAADRLLARGLEAAIVKLGGDGVMVATTPMAPARSLPPYPRRGRLRPRRSGDAFGGAFCHGLLEGWDPWFDTVRYGNAAGAIVANRHDVCRRHADRSPRSTTFLAGAGWLGEPHVAPSPRLAPRRRGAGDCSRPRSPGLDLHRPPTCSTRVVRHADGTCRRQPAIASSSCLLPVVGRRRRHRRRSMGRPSRSTGRDVGLRSGVGLPVRRP